MLLLSQTARVTEQQTQDGRWSPHDHEAAGLLGVSCPSPREGGTRRPPELCTLLHDTRCFFPVSYRPGWSLRKRLLSPRSWARAGVPLGRDPVGHSAHRSMVPFALNFLADRSLDRSWNLLP